LATVPAFLFSVLAAAPGLTSAGPAPADSPAAIVIEAAQGIEWQRDARTVIARGNATAKRGDTEVRADVLTARYRERPDGSYEVSRIEADGGVRLTSPQQSASGEKGSYDVEAGKMSLSGGRQVSVTTPSSEIRADERIDYDLASKTLVARGDAVVVEGDRTLHGDVITIRLAEDAQGRARVQRIEADGDMRMVTPEETVTADHGTYDIKDELATASGSVQIIQGSNRLSGCQAEMNLRTGVSRLSACPGESGGARVQGVILPNTLKKN
jgi:lipopolysaccharide export system protein LptA